MIAIEMTLGAVVAGPFDIPESILTGLIQKAIDKWKSGVDERNTKLSVH